MKKIYNFLLLALVFIVSTTAVQAQKRYQIAGGDIEASLTVDDLENGSEFAILNGKLASEMKYDYICGLTKNSAITDECIYKLELGGEDEIGTPYYFLVQKSTGEYLSNNSGAVSYTSVRTRAWAFTIKEASVVTQAQLDANPDETEITDFSCITTSTITGNGIIFAGLGSQPDQKNGTTFFVTNGQGAAPAFSTTDYATNLLGLYSVEEITGAAWLRVMLTEMGLTEDTGMDAFYTEGDQPGQLPTQYYKELEAKLQTVKDLIAEESEDQTACETAINDLKAAIEAARAHQVLVAEGYYFFSSGRSASNGVFDENNKMTWTYNWDPAWTVPTAPGAERAMTMDDVKFVWHVIPDPNNKGAYFLQNYYTKGYIGLADNGKGAKVKTIETPTESFLIYPVGKKEGEVTFSIESTTLIEKPLKGWDNVLPVTALHCASDHNGVCIWEPGNNDGSGWRFYKVNMDELRTFDAQIEQAKRNENLKNVYDKAQADYEAGEYCLTFDGNKNGTVDTNEDGTPKGLLTDVSQLSSNSIETAEGNQLAGLVDSDISTGNFYHSIWKSETATEQGFVPAEAYPNLAVDLRKAVKDIVVKMWPRRNTNGLVVNNLPGKVSIQASNDGENWTQIDTLNMEMAYKYVGNDGTTSTSNAVGMLRITLPEAYSHIRMEVVTRYGSTSDFKELNNLGQGCWNAAEMRIFECWEDPSIALNTAVPADVMNAFKASLEKAKSELDNESATQATIDELTANYEAYTNEVPDPAQVTSALAEAKAQANGAVEGEGYGYFAEGSIAKFTAALKAIESEVKPVMSKAVIDDLKARIAAAVKEFNGSINVPENGALVYLVSKSSAAPANGYVRTAGNGVVRNQWAKDDDSFSDNMAYVWKFIKNADGTYNLQSMLNGEYLNNPKRNNAGVGMSTVADTCGFTLRTAGIEGVFNVVFGDKIFLNAQPNGNASTGALVTWNSASGADNSAFAIESAESFAPSIYFATVKANTYSFLTLPLSVKSNGQCYSVLGRNGSNIELAKIDGDIEAGTPFVYLADEDETSAELELVETDLESLTYATEGKNVNGFVGNLAPITDLHEGYGILSYGTTTNIVDSQKGDAVSANSAYILPSVVTTTETGDAQIAIDGNIDAIHNAAVSANAAVVNVYTLAGVKVRSNVKAENAVNGLPAGLYIVGGQKVLVK